jgi:hypothetical protein
MEYQRDWLRGTFLFDVGSMMLPIDFAQLATPSTRAICSRRLLPIVLLESREISLSHLIM